MKRPTREELLAAAAKTVPDVIARDLDVLFCGINPGLYTAAVGHHFARPGNRFWPALYASGFTPRLMRPDEERELLPLGLGITNLVARASARADELRPEEFRAGARLLEGKARRFRPRWIALLGVQAYRVAFDEPRAAIGAQARTIGASRVWLLPNPSGLNAHFTPAQLGEAFAAFRAAALRRD